ncbi:hypothetical protein C8R45DRAFT_995871 [Mycena sanguinolenta]|nr:hypothetical protein C8R45DRAFT_995871 [Mycena sanguinolenta]
MAKKRATKDPDGPCRIVEIPQFTCVPKYDGGLVVHCVPIPRLFRICPNRPAVEVTRVLNIDLSTGEVEIPQALEQKLPKGKAWTDVTTYNTNP